MDQQYELKLDVETHTPERSKRRRAKPNAVSENKSSRQEHVYRRNREMIARYYYWTEIRRRRFDDVMLILSEEFHVEDRTISNALLDMGDCLNGLYKDRKDMKEFKREYPGRNWDNS